MGSTPDDRVSAQPLKMALTGGIASGKSTVADLFEARGVPVIDTDAIARTVVDQDPSVKPAILAAFGPDAFDDGGNLDRKRLRRIVFSDPQARDRLEAIMHPAILGQMWRQARAAGGVYQILVVPLLLETGSHENVDRVLVVDCPEHVQIARLMARDGETEDAARRMVDAQASRESRLAIADDVIDNSGTVEAVARRVEELDRRYRALGSR